MAFASKGDNKHALEAFLQALRIAPDYIAALAGASQIYYQAGDRRAIPLLHRLVELRPDDPTGHAMLAVLEYREGKCKAAIGHFERGGALRESELDAQHADGTCQARLHKLS